MAVEREPEFASRKEVWMVPVEIHSRADQEVTPQDVLFTITSTKGAVNVRVAGEITQQKGEK